MNRQAPKGITGSVVKRNQDEATSDSNLNNGQELNYEKLIQDMTRGFLEAQTQVNKTQNNNQEMLPLLEKLSMQIDAMKNNLGSNATQAASDSDATAQESISAQTLKDLFSSILQTDSNKQDSLQNKNSDNSQPQGKNSNKVAVQAAAQVLAQAQYELSNELEASLTKLRQVISKSEKIADKISSLLGADNNKQ